MAVGRVGLAPICDSQAGPLVLQEVEGAGAVEGCFGVLGGVDEGWVVQQRGVDVDVIVRIVAGWLSLC